MTNADQHQIESEVHETLASEEGPTHHHVTPFWPMTIVFAALILLTIITALTAHYIDLPGTGNLILALFLASFKTFLVAAWFMHLRYDTKMNTVVVCGTLFGVVLFLGLTMIDLGSRDVTDRVQQGEIVPGGTKRVVETARESAHQEEHNPEAAEAGGADAAEGEANGDGTGEGADGH